MKNKEKRMGANPRRIVVSGLGAVTSLGDKIEEIWKQICQGESFISKLTPDDFFTENDLSVLKTKIGGSIPHMNGTFFDPTLKFKSSFLKKLDPFSIYGVYAAHNAYEDAQLNDEGLDKTRFGITVGAGFGGLKTFDENAVQFLNTGKTAPFFIPKILINILPGHIANYFGLKGPNFSVVSACSTGAHSINSAARLIHCDEADIVMCGGSSTGCCPIAISGFNACNALSTQYNELPEEASRPWDQNRDGFVISNGAAILILEEFEHAKRRGAKIYAELVGYGETADAYHMTTPLEDGEGAERAMKKALQKAKIEASKVGYVNAHATSTPLGDKAELNAIKNVFSTNTLVSSTKSMTGHLLGAAGSLEAIFTILALRSQIAPPTINLNTPDPLCQEVNIVKNTAQNINTEYAITNSFGFGGTNASIIFKKAEAV